MYLKNLKLISLQNKNFKFQIEKYLNFGSKYKYWDFFYIWNF